MEYDDILSIGKTLYAIYLFFKHCKLCIICFCICIIFISMLCILFGKPGCDCLNHGAVTRHAHPCMGILITMVMIVRAI